MSTSWRIWWEKAVICCKAFTLLDHSIPKMYRICCKRIFPNGFTQSLVPAQEKKIDPDEVLHSCVSIMGFVTTFSSRIGRRAGHIASPVARLAYRGIHFADCAGRECGGKVTHDLHIINAVGARLSQKQLKEVLKSPLVTWHIDDLSDTTRPDKEDEEEGCKVRGHIELDFTPQGIKWPLYNKRATPAALERLEIAWPPALGGVTAIFVGDTPVDPVLYQRAAIGSLNIVFPSSRRPVVEERADLKVDFQSFDTPMRQAQHCSNGISR